MMSSYDACDISLVRAGRRLVDAVSLNLVPGRMTVIIGPNGAGKSSLLKLLAGEVRPDAGEVRLDGLPLSRHGAAALARRRAVLPQASELAFPFRVGEVVALGCLDGVPGGVPALVETLLARVDLPGFAERRYDSLSGGERQRVQLARVLAQLHRPAGAPPGYLLLDEPTASLDIGHQLLVLKVARDYAETGGGVLAVLHDLNLAAMSADHLVMMKAGRVIAAGPPDAVLTGARLQEAFGVRVAVGAVPAGPFVLPQCVEAAGA